jgi:hypothetical protein
MKRNPVPSYEEMPMSDAAYELALYIENDGDLYRQLTLLTITNLQKKFTKGTYNHNSAVKLWKYLADAGAQKYTKEHGSRGGSSFGVFTVADRKQVAVWLADKYLEHVKEGYAFKTKSRAKNPAPRIGTASPRRRSQITKKPPTKRLVKRRVVNTKKGYFPNPVDPVEGLNEWGGKAFKFAIVQRPADNNASVVALIPNQKDAVIFVDLLNKHAAKGVLFYVMTR